MTITRETVEARLENLLDDIQRADPCGPSPGPAVEELCLALLARAETAERERDEARSERDDLNANLAHHIAHDRPKKLLADVAALTADRDRLAGELADAKSDFINATEDMKLDRDAAERKVAALTAERDRLAGELINERAKKSDDTFDAYNDLTSANKTIATLTADLAAARAELVRWQEDHESQTARAMCAEEQERIRAHDLAAARKTIAAYEEALTPSAETKSAFWGEFEIVNTQLDDDGEEYTIKSFVPWDAVKEIMKAIRARAAIPQANKTKETES